MSFDPQAARRDFPILERAVRGKPLVFLDTAASAQKPHAVLEELDRFYREEYANIHRGVYWLSERATAAYERARADVARHLNAAEAREIIFTRGATESINLVAQSWGRANVGPGDEILVSEMEHHSNIVPWQMLAVEKGARVVVIPMNDRGELRLDEYARLLAGRVRLVAVTQQSNALGTVNPVAQMIRQAHAAGAVVLVDAAQSIVHQAVDVRALDCDFLAFSGHKLYGPTGVGALYGKAALLSAMPPWQGGGEMIRSVSFKGTTYKEIPERFEAGTPAIAQAVGLGAAVRYLALLDRESVERHEAALLAHALERLAAVPGLTLVGTAAARSGVVSFTLANVHPHDIGTILDTEGVCIRAGHHCAQPVMEHFGIPATARVSLGLYNTKEDIDAMVQAVQKAVEMFR